MNKKKYQQPELEILKVSLEAICGINGASGNSIPKVKSKDDVQNLDLSDDESSVSPFSSSYVD